MSHSRVVPESLEVVPDSVNIHSWLSQNLVLSNSKFCYQTWLYSIYGIDATEDNLMVDSETPICTDHCQVWIPNKFTKTYHIQ